jgi:hypothetical protein
MHATQTAAWTTDAVTPATTPATFDALSSSLRRAGRALAADATRRDDRTAVAAATRPIVTAMRAELRHWRGRGGAGEDTAAAWSRMVDAAVQEAYRMARFQSGQTGIVAPLTVLATGSYADHAPRPERPVPLLLVVPADRRELSGRRMARYLTQNLRAFGLSVSATVVAGRQSGDRGRLLAGSATLLAGAIAAAH